MALPPTGGVWGTGCAKYAKNFLHSFTCEKKTVSKLWNSWPFGQGLGPRAGLI